MKKIVSLLMCSLVVVNLFGCADRAAYNTYNETFDSNAKAYYEVAGKPLMDMKLPAPEGKEYHLVVNREVKPLMPQQIKDSEWTGAVTAGIVGAATVGLGVVKFKMTESDNDAKVKMNESDNEAATAQLRDYVQSFNKETVLETTTILEGSELNNFSGNTKTENP
jgi:hypothetical protein